MTKLYLCLLMFYLCILIAVGYLVHDIVVEPLEHVVQIITFTRG